MLLLGYALLFLVFLRIANLVYVIYNFFKKLATQDMLQVNLQSFDLKKNLQLIPDTLLLINYILTPLCSLCFPSSKRG